MSNKKHILILVLLGILSIIVGFILMFITNIKEDQQQLNNNISKINKDYAGFKKDIEEVNKTRDELHKNILDTVYYESFESSENEYKKALYNYEKTVTDISKKYANLKGYCEVGIYYSSSDANSKCNAFNLGYEQLINTFVDDINMYNSNVKKYNSWLDEQQNTTSKKLEGYKTKKTYIDYNKDGEYSGKEDK